MGGRINTIMQTCFFAISGVLPREEAIAQIKKAIEKTYGKKGGGGRAAELRRGRRSARPPARGDVPGDGHLDARRARRSSPENAPDFVKRVTARDARGQGRPAAGQRLPGGRHLADRRPRSGRSATSRSRSRCGTRRSASSATSARWSARTPPSAPRSMRPTTWTARPPTFKCDADYKARRVQGAAVHDPGGAGGLHRLRPLRRGLPGEGQGEPGHKAINMAPQAAAARARAATTTTSSSTCPSPTARRSKLDVKGSQFLQPLFEFSGACAGCGETPYLKLLTQLFGDRALIANATGCSSIYGGNLPTTPYTTNARRPRPGLVELAVRGQRRVRPRLAAGHRRARAPRGRDCSHGARRRRRRQPGRRSSLEADQSNEAGIDAQRERVAALRSAARGHATARRRAAPRTLADYLVKKSVWIVGGDGWAYDIGYGGLDHVLSMQAQRQHPGARHRGLLEHRRPGIEGHAAGRGGEVRRGGQGDGQEGPGPDGDELRPRLRGARSPSGPRTRRP